MNIKIMWKMSAQSVHSIYEFDERRKGRLLQLVSHKGIMHFYNNFFLKLLFYDVYKLLLYQVCFALIQSD